MSKLTKEEIEKNKKVKEAWEMSGKKLQLEWFNHSYEYWCKSSDQNFNYRPYRIKKDADYSEHNKEIKKLWAMYNSPPLMYFAPSLNNNMFVDLKNPNPIWESTFFYIINPNVLLVEKQDEKGVRYYSWKWKNKSIDDATPEEWDTMAYANKTDIEPEEWNGLERSDNCFLPINSFIDSWITAAPSALNEQVGGNHYKDCAIQPVEYITKNNLPFLEGCVIKRVTRHNKPTGKGREDIEKAIHELKLILELTYNLEN